MTAEEVRHLKAVVGLYRALRGHRDMNVRTAQHGHEDWLLAEARSHAYGNAIDDLCRAFETGEGSLERLAPTVDNLEPGDSPAELTTEKRLEIWISNLHVVAHKLSDRHERCPKSYLQDATGRASCASWRVAEMNDEILRLRRDLAAAKARVDVLETVGR